MPHLTDLYQTILVLSIHHGRFLYEAGFLTNSNTRSASLIFPASRNTFSVASQSLTTLARVATSLFLLEAFGLNAVQNLCEHPFQAAFILR